MNMIADRISISVLMGVDFHKKFMIILTFTYEFIRVQYNQLTKLCLRTVQKLQI